MTKKWRKTLLSGSIENWESIVRIIAQFLAIFPLLINDEFIILTLSYRKN